MTFSKVIIENYQNLINSVKNDKFVQDRYEHNVLRNGIEVSTQSFWHALVLGIITTQINQKKLDTIKRGNGSIFDYDFCLKLQKEHNSLELINNEICHAIRFKNKTPNFILQALNIVSDSNEWKKIHDYLITLEVETSLEKERIVANSLQSFSGIGLKQSRNIIQIMGLSQYVIPIDSRMINAIQCHGGIKLPDISRWWNTKEYYEEVEDQIVKLATALNIKPCLFDACIFKSGELK